ncbi:THO complex subunit 1 [Echria macrotheca]|uniref:THO complex subunit 1 n=1 Tax=Echria macrotheca TaxID=438768 RepID=A0AAJ0B598_9PEZI|nr:THO complex subunit 1 [Echria macrotheca]
MPSATIDSHGIDAVADVGAFLEKLLEHAESVKPTTAVEPPLDKSDFGYFQDQLNRILGPQPSPKAGESADARKSQRFAIIETAVRDIFSNLIATVNIDSPSAVKIWNLLDILSILSDAEQCDPALLFWLVEELLDSQTIAGCRKVFDFLESRRERIVAKHFKQKQLVILRTCNELLRRLSRPLEPAFCGRVFIFMFQSFPLGDKSSVNLRGEYHVENVTDFDREPLPAEGTPDKMDVDTEDKTAKAGDGKKQPDQPLDPDALYLTFWSLQETFNQPKKLFEGPDFAAFKSGLEATMATFRSIKPEQSSRSKEKLDKQVEENSGSLNRKKAEGELEDELAGSFNPKYLTSRDLFKLEISDLAFRRNILVQALIIMDFLLALSPKAKEKLSNLKNINKSVAYSEQVLSDEDARWAADMKRGISDYLKQGSEGPYFFRMVETVLSRDKNWVRWKIEGCPSIELPPVSPETFNEVRQATAKLAGTRRLRATPMGSLSLDFLEDEDETSAMDRLKSKERYELPELSSYKRGIAEDDLEIDMPTSNQSKLAAIEAKASKTWRALRIARGFKLAAFDKIESEDNIDVIFEETPATDEVDMSDVAAGDAIFPEDFRPVVLVDAASRTSRLASDLMAKYPGTFTKVPSHVTRKPEEGESNGKGYYFVDSQKFNVMRDGDQFLAYNEDGDWCSGISRRTVESISENGKVPLLVLDHDVSGMPVVGVAELTGKQGAQQVKDNGFSARFIFVRPPVSDILEGQLRDSGLGEAEARKAAESANKLVEQASTGELFDTIVDPDLGSFESVIFGPVLNGTGPKAEGQAEDVTMDDAGAKAN